MCPCYNIFFILIVLLLSIVYRSGSDCSNDVLIKDGGNDTIISPGKTFELGFFTPDGSVNLRRFLGIWYYQSNPKVVVWVANRGKPLLESNGCLAIRDGNAKMLDAKGMNLRDILVPLTSWQSRDNPAAGKWLLPPSSQLDQTLVGLSIYNSNGSIHWKKEDIFDEIPPALSELLFRSTSGLEINSTTRLVMNFTGELQFWKLEVKSGWSLIWTEPKDNCSLYNSCGGFGSCNSNNVWSCKCLPGFEHSAADKWNPGDLSDGCSPISEPCNQGSMKPFWLRLPMMKVGQEREQNGNTAAQDCETKCQESCDCVAYSCGRTDCKEKGASGCSMWTSTKLTNLQEEYSRGVTIFIRTTRSDIALTPVGCNPCGTNIIPYPLSYEANCGDPSYSYFRCNTSTGQLDFLTSDRTFKVVAVSREERRFTVQIRNASHYDRTYIESHILSTNSSLLFSVINCSLVNQSFAGVRRVEVEMAWKPPPGPACKTSLNCRYWTHTTCKAAGDGYMRCICGSKFRWDAENLKCMRALGVKYHLKVVASCISGALAIILLCGMLFIHYVQKRRIAKKKDSFEFPGDDTGGIDVPFFDWGSIVAATNNFADDNKLGTGGFGAVYKGKLPDGKEIAVKRLSSVSEQGIEEFRTEVVLIAKLQHRNLVRLVGYGVKTDERILVYEFMPNGSLDSCLFDQTRRAFLDWEKRFDVIFGIARGLLYLHQDSRLRIIHRDLKPSNILLDEEMNPKISDFGIARIVGGKETEGSTKRVVGTYGYMSPEYAYEGLFSVKSDVFSFGVVMLETISGRRNSKLFQLEFGLNLQGYAWKLWNEDKGLDLMDQALRESCNQSEALKCIHIGLLCVQEDPSDRPTMSSVVLMLGSENASLPPPKQPAFISKKAPSETASSSSIVDSSSNDVMTFPQEAAKMSSLRSAQSMSNMH